MMKHFTGETSLTTTAQSFLWCKINCAFYRSARNVQTEMKLAVHVSRKTENCGYAHAREMRHAPHNCTLYEGSMNSVEWSGVWSGLEWLLDWITGLEWSTEMKLLS